VGALVGGLLFLCMKTINFTAFDFETATYDRMPCQLGLVVVRESKIVEEKKFLIKPPGNIYDPGCTRVHKIKSKDTESCEEFNDIWRKIKPYFANELMVAHSVDFDVSVLHKAISYYELDDVRPLSYVCTLTLFNRKSLKDVVNALNIKMEEHHDALSDARACANIYIEYLKGINVDELNYPEKKPKQKIFNPEKINNNRISSEAKKQDLSIVKNTNNLFYNKKIVISGTFENFPIRNDLAVLLKKYGADINCSISKKTNIFITGSDFGPKKMEEVLSLQTDGYNIKIINESELILELTKLE